MHNGVALAKAFASQDRAHQALGAYLDYRLSLISRKAIVRHYPPALMLEPTNICNLKCPLCPSGNATLTRPRGMMPLELFQDIVDQVQHKIGMLILWNQGEAFLNPDFIHMIEYASARGLYTLASTNASFTMDAGAVVKSGLSKLIISLDGTNQESYGKYRVNGDFALVMQNLRELIAMKRSLGYQSPQIVWQFIVMRHNEEEIPYLQALAKDMGVDKLELKTAQIYSVDDLKYLPNSHKYSRYSQSAQRVELKTRLLNRCRRLWTQPVINWDGEFSICCYDKDLEYPVGSLHQESFASLWFGSKMQAMRQRVLRDRAGIPICRNCGEGIVQKIH